MPIPIFVISGPSGCGKTTVSERIGKLERFGFVEGDELHPQANIHKMTRGQPLTDTDRWGWLADVREKAVAMAKEDGARGVIITCSALKRTYREVLLEANRDNADVALSFVFLNVSEGELVRRMENRKGHYMKRSMLESQLRDLEMPKEGQEKDTYVVQADKSIDETEAAVLKVVASVLATVNKESEEEK